MRVLGAVIFALALAAVCAVQAAAQPNEGFADLNDRLSPAVVNIATAQRVGDEDGSPLFAPGTPLERYNDLSGNRLRMQRSLGSGFIIDADGVVITNHHVIDGADEVEVVLQNGRILSATVVGSDPATDIAVLRVQSHAHGYVDGHIFHEFLELSFLVKVQLLRGDVGRRGHLH